MKQLATLVFSLLFSLVSQAQLSCGNSLICDNFDSYATGALGPQAAHWSTWSGTEGGAEDGIVSNDFAYSGTNSMQITGQNGPQDVLLLLGDQANGHWRLEFKMYVYDGQRAYWNLQKYQAAPGNYYGQEVFFKPDGTGSMDAGATDAATFAYPHDEWFEVVQFMDLDNDRASLFVAGQPVYSWPFSVSSQGTSSPLLQIGAIDFYATNDGNHLFYIDDVRFKQLPANTAASRLVQVNVDLEYENEAPEGVSVTGSFNGWSTAPMENKGNKLWQAYLPVPDGDDLTYNFVNGSAWEIVPAACGLEDGGGNFNRFEDLDDFDLVLDTVCFGLCVDCALTQTKENQPLDAQLSIAPNPASGSASVDFVLSKTPTDLRLRIVGFTGQILSERKMDGMREGRELIDLQGFSPGIYFVQLVDEGRVTGRKLVVE